jgi:hypothetical protein
MRRSRISGSMSAMSAAVSRPARRMTVWNWPSAARQPWHPSTCSSMRLRWPSLTSPSRYAVTKPTNSMHWRSSLPDPLPFKATRLPLEVAFQACANETAGVIEQGSLLVGAKIQRSAGLAGRPSFDVAKHDHLP